MLLKQKNLQSKPKGGSNAFLKSIQALGKSSRSSMKILREKNSDPSPTTDKNQQGSSESKKQIDAGKYQGNRRIVTDFNEKYISDESQKEKMTFKMMHKNPQSSKPKSKRIRVKILNDKFEPAQLKIEKGQTVEWSLKFELENNHSSLYHLKNRTHVVSFKDINEESGLMRTVTDSFRVKFTETGFFQYKCSIYTRMVGSIEVVEPARDIKVQTVKEIQNIQMNSLKPLKAEAKNPVRTVYDNMQPVGDNEADLSKRLIKVLGEEEDLRDSAQADTKTPFIKQQFYREIFESNRGSMAKSYVAELESDREKTEQSNQEDSEAAECLFLKQQRISSKVSLQIVNQEIKIRDLTKASIEDRKKKGYWQIPPKKIMEINPPTEDESYNSSEALRQSFTSVTPSSCQANKYSEFSRMLHHTQNQTDSASDFGASHEQSEVSEFIPVKTDSSRKVDDIESIDVKVSQFDLFKTDTQSIKTQKSQQPKKVKDDQSELDEISALSKQRQNQKKKLRKKMKKQQQKKVQNIQDIVNQFDNKLSSVVTRNINSDELIMNLVERSVQDEFITNQVNNEMQHRFEKRIQSCMAF